jgi:hypothetical protein
MRRKKPGECVAKLRGQDGEPFISLRRKAARWAGNDLEALKAARPELPEGLNDRAQDNWEPLLAIADLASGDWPLRARTAALSLTGAEIEDDSLGVQLLADTVAMFTRLKCERLFSKRLVAELVADETKPWATFKNGKPITERLSGFGIKPANQRTEDGQAKGYAQADFEDAIERYVPSARGARSVPAVPSNEIKDLEQNLSVPTDLSGTDENGSNSLKLNDGTLGTDQNLLANKIAVAAGAACAQCNGLSDGTEQPHLIAGQTVWLHKECRRFYAKAERDGLP